MYCFINGKIVNEKYAKIPLDDSSFLHGYGVYETIRVKNNKILYGEDHVQRLFSSAKFILLKIPYSKSLVYSKIKQLIEKNKLKNTKVRITVSENTFLITTRKFEGYSKIYYKKGATIVTYKEKRFIPKAKTTSCVDQLVQRKIMKNAVDALIIDNKQVAECTNSNIFCIKDGIVYTPKNRILEGITKKHVIKKLKQYKIKVIEKDFKLDFLLSADECFITSSLKGVMPVVKIDNKKIGNGKIGKITKKLLNF